MLKRNELIRFEDAVDGAKVREEKAFSVVFSEDEQEREREEERLALEDCCDGHGNEKCSAKQQQDSGYVDYETESETETSSSCSRNHFGQPPRPRGADGRTGPSQGPLGREGKITPISSKLATLTDNLHTVSNILSQWKRSKCHCNPSVCA